MYVFAYTDCREMRGIRGCEMYVLLLGLIQQNSGGLGPVPWNFRHIYSCAEVIASLAQLYRHSFIVLVTQVMLGPLEVTPPLWHLQALCDGLTM